MGFFRIPAPNPLCFPSSAGLCAVGVPGFPGISFWAGLEQSLVPQLGHPCTANVGFPWRSFFPPGSLGWIELSLFPRTATNLEFWVNFVDRNFSTGLLLLFNITSYLQNSISGFNTMEFLNLVARPRLDR